MAATARDLSKVESVIRLKGVNKWFGQFHVLTDINLDVKEGEKIVVAEVTADQKASRSQGQNSNPLTGGGSRRGMGGGGPRP